MQVKEEEILCPQLCATENKTTPEDLFCLVALKLQNVSIRHTPHPPTIYASWAVAEEESHEKI